MNQIQKDYTNKIHNFFLEIKKSTKKKVTIILISTIVFITTIGNRLAYLFLGYISNIFLVSALILLCAHLKNKKVGGGAKMAA